MASASTLTLSGPVANLLPLQGYTDAGWSSLVARWAHNPKVAGSNPVPATTPTDGFPGWVMIPAGIFLIWTSMRISSGWTV